jgi:hypothetical protein
MEDRPFATVADNMKRIAIIGAGISGLTAGYELKNSALTSPSMKKKLSSVDACRPASKTDFILTSALTIFATSIFT